MRSPWVAVVALFLPSIANAAEEAAFPKGTANIGSTAAWYRGLGSDVDISAYEGRLSVGYYVVDNVAFVGELTFEQFDGERDREGVSVSAGGAAAQLRWHFVRQGPWSFFADGGFGFVFLNEALWTADQRQRWTRTFGGGVSFRFNEALDFIGGVRKFYVSSDVDFPFDSFGGYLGFFYEF